MGLYSWVFGKKRKAPNQSTPTSTTIANMPNRNAKVCGYDAPGNEDEAIIEELMSDDAVSDVEMDSSDELLYQEIRSLGKQLSTSQPGSVATSQSSSAVDLFGDDKIGFLDVLRKVNASLTFPQSTASILGKMKDSVDLNVEQVAVDEDERLHEQQSARNGHADQENDESNGGINLESPVVLGHWMTNTLENGDQKPDCAEADNQTSSLNDEVVEMAKNEEKQVVGIAAERIAILKRPKVNGVPDYFYNPMGNSNWANDDEWVEQVVGIEEQAVVEKSRTNTVPGCFYKPVGSSNGVDMDDGKGSALDEEFRLSNMLKGDGSSDTEAIMHGGPALARQGSETTPKEEPDSLSSKTGTVTSQYSRSESEYGAGYSGPSRSLAQPAWVDRFRNEEQWRDCEEEYKLQIKELFERLREEIEMLQEPSTIQPQEKDLHDEEMHDVFVNVYPALPSHTDSGQMHILDWKTLLNPDMDEGQFILNFVKPRLCDVVATLLFQSDPEILDAFLDQRKKVVEWWHKPHYLHHNAFSTVIRRSENKVIVGTFSDHGFKLCWSCYIEVEIKSDGQWNEIFAFNGIASSRKIYGEVDWDSFESLNPQLDDEDELWDPVEALWHGRVLAHRLMRVILRNWYQYRDVNPVEWVVDGNMTALEERDVQSVPRINGVVNDQTAEMVSSSGMPSKVLVEDVEQEVGD